MLVTSCVQCLAHNRCSANTSRKMDESYLLISGSSADGLTTLSWLFGGRWVWRGCLQSGAALRGQTPCFPLPLSSASHWCVLSDGVGSTCFLVCSSCPVRARHGTGTFSAGTKQALAGALGEGLRGEAGSFSSFLLSSASFLILNIRFLEATGLSDGPEEGGRGLDPILSLTGTAQPQAL